MTDGPDPKRAASRAQEPNAEREFVYSVRRRADPQRGSGPAFRFVVLGVLACAIAYRFGHGGWGLGILALLIACAVWASWRQARHDGGVVLRVEGGKLLVYRSRPAAESAVVDLEDLHDVVLDTRRARGAQAPPRGGRGGRRGGGGRGIDESRIELVLAPGVSPIVLADAYASHSETVEQISKLKMFLRRLGWVPEDERAASLASGMVGEDHDAPSPS